MSDIRTIAKGIEGAARAIQDLADAPPPRPLPMIHVSKNAKLGQLLEAYSAWQTGRDYTSDDAGEEPKPVPEPPPAPLPPPAPPGTADVIPVGPLLWWESRTPTGNFGLKTPFSSASITGKVAGAYNIRVLHGNHPAHRAFITGRAAVSDFFARAMGDGVDALGLDDENESWNVETFSMIVREAKRYNLPFVDFPKCGHKLNGPGYRKGVNGYQGDINLFNDLGVDASIEWLYGDAASNIGTDAALRASGFQGQRGLIHDLFRWQPDKGYKGRVEGWKVLDYCARTGIVFGSFQHGHAGHPDPVGDAARMNAAYGR